MFQHSLVSLFWGHELQSLFSWSICWVSALSGESILGPLHMPSQFARLFWFQHSLVSLFWGHSHSEQLECRQAALFQHSLVSLFWGHAMWQNRKTVRCHDNREFQHSLVSLFWGHQPVYAWPSFNYTHCFSTLW